jgi:uncharacterized iron-regulated membrane protein
MNLRKETFRLHRWLGLIIGLQLLAWSLGGLYFTLFDIEVVRGAADAVEQEPASFALPESGIPARDAVELAVAAGVDAGEILSLAALSRRGRSVWELRGAGRRPLALVELTTGELLAQMSREEAEAVALADFVHPATVLESTLIEADPPGEFRGGRLPAWQVVLDHPKQLRIYVDAVNGQVLSRRNRVWRWFDFFWMLHIMDYDEREDFHHPLLTAASAFAVLTSLTGILLWGFRLAPRRRKRR